MLAGTVDFALDSTGTALPLVQGGQYRALAKYTNQPLPQFPGVPSLSEASGLPSIDESSTWIAIAAPCSGVRTPRNVRDHTQLLQLIALGRPVVVTQADHKRVTELLHK